MADFCKACSLEHFGKDFRELADLITADRVAEGYYACVICEGCGYIQVDHDGNCVSDDCSLAGLAGHGVKPPGVTHESDDPRDRRE